MKMRACAERDSALAGRLSHMAAHHRTRANQRRRLNHVQVSIFPGSQLSFSHFPQPSSPAMSEPQHFRATYNDVHKLLRASAEKIAEFKPDMLIAIGRCFVSRTSERH